jgi:hypothetical protein
MKNAIINLLAAISFIALTATVSQANASQTDVKLEIIDAVVCSQMSMTDKAFDAETYLEEERTMYNTEFFMEAMSKGNARVSELTMLESFDADAVEATVNNHCESF